MDVIKEVAVYIVYVLTGFFTWLVPQFFSLKERMSRLEDRVQNNFDQDEARTKREEKLWEAVETIKSDIHELKTEIKLLVQRGS